MFSDLDSFLFHEGTNYQAYNSLGAHVTRENGVDGVRFAVYAPNAKNVSVIASVNNWDPCATPMTPSDSGVWQVFVPGMYQGYSYRYVVVGADGVSRYKADPFAFFSELRPEHASVVWGLNNFEWSDHEYMNRRKEEDAAKKPMAIYEVHLGSWKKDYGYDPNSGFLNYRRLADELSDYVCYMGFTHVELMGICEYPFDGSWGYQVTGYFSPTSRYGNPDDFKYFVNRMHERGIGVIIDWVPAHYPKDDFGLEHFDGTSLYESADPLLAEYPEWGTYAFDHSKPEVRSFLISSAFYWVNVFHADALRVDAVAAMLYTNFSRAEWRPNVFGGTANLSSIDFLKQLNNALDEQTDAYLIAEDSSEENGVTKPVKEGGMGFRFKWNMGWMNDTLEYFTKNPVYRQYHHSQLTHTSDYVFNEYFVNVLSHDEVVHLKKSMLGKMPGGTGDKLADLKTLYAYMFAHPGKKLLFMGQEFAQESEWDENREIDWYFANEMWHRDVMECLRLLLAVYRRYPCLYSDSLDHTTFEWVNRSDYTRNTVSFIRRNPWNYDGAILVVCNFSPMQYNGYTCGTPMGGWHKRIFSTYDTMPGGGDPGSEGTAPLTPAETECDGYRYTLYYDLRPFETLYIELPGEG